MDLTVLIGSLDDRTRFERKALAQHIAEKYRVFGSAVAMHPVCMKDLSEGPGSDLRMMVEGAFRKENLGLYVGVLHQNMSKSAQEEYRYACRQAAMKDIPTISFLKEGAKEVPLVKNLLNGLTARLFDARADTIIGYANSLQLPEKFDEYVRHYFVNLAKKASVSI